MTRVITVLSGKGGVGKTFVTANLGVTLAEMGKDITILDGNLTTPNLGLHLGIPLFPKTLHDVLKGKAKIHDALYEHDSGLKIIPAGISLSDLKGIDASDLPSSLLGMLGGTDILMIDAAAGLGREALASIESSDEMLLITNPELPAVLDVMKAAKLARQMGVKIIGVVINKSSGKKYELTDREIGDLIEAPVISKIPEEDSVKEAISLRMPVVKYRPNCNASMEIRRLASFIAGESFDFNLPWHKRIFGMLFR